MIKYLYCSLYMTKETLIWSFQFGIKKQNMVAIPPVFLLKSNFICLHGSYCSIWTLWKVQCTVLAGTELIFFVVALWCCVLDL